QRVRRCYRELACGRDDEHIPKLAGEKEVAPIRNRRGGEALRSLAQSLAVTDCARFGIETGEPADVEARIKVIANDDGSLHVVALARVRPDDGGISLPSLGRGNVATRIQANGTDRAEAAVCACEIG